MPQVTFCALQVALAARGEELYRQRHSSALVWRCKCAGRERLRVAHCRAAVTLGALLVLLLPVPVLLALLPVLAVMLGVSVTLAHHALKQSPRCVLNCARTCSSSLCRDAAAQLYIGTSAESATESGKTHNRSFQHWSQISPRGQGGHTGGSLAQRVTDLDCAGHIIRQLGGSAHVLRFWLQGAALACAPGSDGKFASAAAYASAGSPPTGRRRDSLPRRRRGGLAEKGNGGRGAVLARTAILECCTVLLRVRLPGSSYVSPVYFQTTKRSSGRRAAWSAAARCMLMLPQSAGCGGARCAFDVSMFANRIPLDGARRRRGTPGDDGRPAAWPGGQHAAV